MMTRLERDACRSCLIHKTCLIKYPETGDGYYTWDSETCINWTCGDGLKAARDAVHSQAFEQIFLSDGTLKEAARFGTPHKPTHEKFPARYCGEDGIIYVGTPECVKPTGQKVRALVLKNRASEDYLSPN